MLRQVWTGSARGASGFLQPDPPPPIVIGAFGPKMTELAGRVGDGVNLSASPSLEMLLGIARAAHRDAGRDPDQFLVTASSGLAAAWLDPDSDRRRRLESLGVDRLVLFVSPPYLDAIRH